MKTSALSLRVVISGFLTCVVFSVGLTPRSAAVELITNGNFESGSLAGWTVFDQAGGSGSFFLGSVGAPTPSSGFATAPNPAGGSFFAVSDQGGPGSHALLQSFSVAPGSQVSLSFQMFVNNQAGVNIVNPLGLDYTAFPNEHGRVDILKNGASALSTNPADIVANLYLGSDPGVPPNAYTNYLFNLSSQLSAGGTFQLRFAEVDNQLFFNLGVDNVSLQVTTTAVPEPSAMLLWATLSLVGVRSWSKRRGLRA